MAHPRTPRWDREEQVALIRSRIWEYLTSTVAPEQIITVSYAVSRILGIALQHHALILLRRRR